MSLAAAFHEHTPSPTAFVGAVADWYDNIDQADKDFIHTQIASGRTGWKRALWHAARANGLEASETRFREFLTHLENEANK